jgi:tRNA A37 threonylcarbamoyladenosine dehydratase
LTSERHERTAALLGEPSLSRLSQSHTAVVGLGGVGGFAAEALARSGVGALTLIDFDVVAQSNINRQIPALTSTVGLPKAEVMASRCRDINPDCRVSARTERFTAVSRETLLTDEYDILLDCIDSVTDKADLIAFCLRRGVAVLSVMGMGNKVNPFALRMGDIFDTAVCPLAKALRRELRKRGVESHRVLWSDEKPARPASRRVASVCWVPGCAGLMLAYEAVTRLCHASDS